MYSRVYFKASLENRPAENLPRTGSPSWKLSIISMMKKERISETASHRIEIIEIEAEKVVLGEKIRKTYPQLFSSAGTGAVSGQEKRKIHSAHKKTVRVH